MSTKLEHGDNGFLKGSRKRRLTAKAAVTDWPELLAAVRAEADDDNLQRLCSLLDAVDRWVCQRWGTAGHDERRASLAAMRADAREANRLVSGTSRETGRRRAEETNRKRAVARASYVARAVPGPHRVEDSRDGPSAA